MFQKGAWHCADSISISLLPSDNRSAAITNKLFTARLLVDILSLSPSLIYRFTPLYALASKASCFVQLIYVFGSECGSFCTCTGKIYIHLIRSHISGVISEWNYPFEWDRRDKAKLINSPLTQTLLA